VPREAIVESMESGSKGRLRLVGISGSLRRASYNTAALVAMGELAPPDVEVAIVPLNGIPMFNDDDFAADGFPPVVAQLRAEVERADGIIIASPEYNHSMTGALKNAIDWLSRKPVSIYGKPVAIVSAAGSLLGGSRGQYDVRKVLQPLEALVLAMPEVFIGRAQEKFDAQGRLTDAATRKVVAEQLAVFREWILRLRMPAGV
jgi:chromate reductase, NAD(P)H dehydrogenase (quinone)